MAYIVALRDHAQNKVYPRTTAAAVYVDTQTTLADQLTTIADDIDDKLDSTASVHEMVMVSDSTGNITTDTQISLDELHTLNGVSSNLQTQLNGKQNKIKIWRLKKDYSEGLQIGGTGKVLFADASVDNPTSTGGTMTAIPSSAIIIGCRLLSYSNYNYGLNCFINENLNVYLCGIPSNVVKNKFEDQTHNTITSAQVLVAYIEN